MVNDKKKPRGGEAVNSGPIWYLADMLNPSGTVKFEIHVIQTQNTTSTFPKDFQKRPYFSNIILTSKKLLT